MCVCVCVYPISFSHNHTQHRCTYVRKNGYYTLVSIEVSVIQAFFPPKNHSYAMPRLLNSMHPEILNFLPVINYEYARGM